MEEEKDNNNKYSVCFVLNSMTRNIDCFYLKKTAPLNSFCQVCCLSSMIQGREGPATQGPLTRSLKSLGARVGADMGGWRPSEACCSPGPGGSAGGIGPDEGT